MEGTSMLGRIEWYRERLERAEAELEACHKERVDALNRATSAEIKCGELEAKLEHAKYVVCSYCGHKTTTPGKTEEQVRKELLEHQTLCDERPEKTLLWLIEEYERINHAVLTRAESAEAELARLTTLRPASEHDRKTTVLCWYKGRPVAVSRIVISEEQWTPLPEPKEEEK